MPRTTRTQEEKLKLIGTTGRAAVLYVLLATMNRAVAMLILPFVTHVMSPAEFGAASTVGSATMVLISVLAMPLDTLVVYAAPRPGDEPRGLVRVAGLYCYYLFPLASLVPAAIFGLFVPELLGIPGKIWAIEIIAIGMMPALSTYALPMVKVTRELKKFVWLAAVSTATVAISKMIFLVVLRMGVLGWVLSDLISSALAGVMAMVLVRPPRVRITRDHIKRVAAFAIPLIPHTLAVWAMIPLSRPALAMVSTLEQVGLLAAGLTVITPVIMFRGELNRALQPRFSQEVFPAPTEQTFTAVRWLMVSTCAMPAAAGCALVFLGPWIFAEAFWPAFNLTGILLLAQAAAGIYTFAINYLILTAGISNRTSIASASGAAVLTAAIFGFGSRYGAMAVACGMLGGQLVMATVAVLLTRVAKLGIAWSAWRRCWPEILASATALALSVAALAEPARSVGAGVLALISLLLLAAAGLLLVRRRLVAQFITQDNLT